MIFAPWQGEIFATVLQSGVSSPWRLGKTVAQMATIVDKIANH
jgi:hypothetical protein